MIVDLDRLPGRANCTGDFWFEHSNLPSSRRFDLLVFADSRGFALERPSASWTMKLYAATRARGLSVMLVVRPRNVTGLFTLCNFLELSNIVFRSAVCQVGMAEFTPKPEDVLQDLVLQKEACFAGYEIGTRQLDRSLVFTTAIGGAEPVAGFQQTYALDIDKEPLKDAIALQLQRHFEYALLLGAVEPSEAAKISRIRPKSYFEQVRASNRYLQSLAARGRALHFIEPLKGSSADGLSVLHDGAHYTERSHEFVFEIAQAVLTANTVDF